MIFNETKLEGVFIIEPEKKEDQRGFFAQIWDKKKFEEMNLNPNLVQSSISYNKKRGTVRGLHFQIPPYEEIKLIRCTKGKIFDVVIDLRPFSRTYTEWVSIELSDQNRKMIYVPEKFAHGFQTLEDNTEVYYQMSEYYKPESARGVRWDDPLFSIKWPIAVATMLKRDAEFSNYSKEIQK